MTGSDGAEQRREALGHRHSPMAEECCGQLCFYKAHSGSHKIATSLDILYCPSHFLTRISLPKTKKGLGCSDQ